MGAGASNEGCTIRQERSVTVVTPPRMIPPQANASLLVSGDASCERPSPNVKSLDAFSGQFLDTSVPGVWEFEEFAGEWKSFDSECSARMEQAFVQGKSEVSIIVKGRLDTVMFHCWKERLSHGAHRNIRRVKEKSLDGTLSGATSSRRVTVTDVDPFNTVASLGITTRSESGGDASDVPDVRLQPQLLSKIHAHEAPVYGVTFNLAGDKLVTGAKDGTCKYWEVQTSYLLCEMEQHPGSVLSCSLSKAHESLIATGCDDCNARIFKCGSKQPAYVLSGHDHKVYGVSFTADGRQLVTVSMDCTMKVWDASNAECVRNSQAHGSSIFSVQTSNRSPWLAITAGDDSILAAHDLRLMNTVTHRFVGHDKTLWGCDIRYDDGQFLSCGMDSKVLTWDPRNPSGPVHVYSAHRNPVHCVEYMPDGETFLSSARDRSFKMTVTSTGSELFSCEAHDGNVYKVTYNAATEVAVTCGSDAIVKLWKLPRLVE